MDNAANIDAIETLNTLRAELTRVGQRIAGALDEAENEVQRTAQWLRQDCPRRWKDQLRKRQDAVSAAKAALRQKKIWDNTVVTPTSHIDEKKAVALAERRYEEAQQKLRRISQGQIQMEREGAIFKNHLQRMRHAVEIEVPNAKAWIDRMVESLENYLSLAAPETNLGAEGEPEQAESRHFGPGVEVQPPQTGPAGDSHPINEGRKTP
jgi:hypothetical protein